MPPLPFLRSQRLYALRPDADPREAVHPERFHTARRGRDERGAGPAAPDDELWEEMPRAALDAGEWNGRSFHRVALTTDAGIGKTYNLRALAHELNAPRQPVVAFVLSISELPAVAALISMLAGRVHNAEGNTGLDVRRIEKELARKRDAGRIALLCDGLDQVGDPAAVERL
ncbi:MAG: ATP-binding protein, partial [Gemmataceae bacterium]|nr:ATP-binding protein [Gemmataceae bacterium]